MNPPEDTSGNSPQAGRVDPATLSPRRYPLAGIRIVDLSRLLPAPYCTMFLADLGADVIRVEEPGFGDLVHWAPPFYEAPSGAKRRRAALDMYLNRNKRSVALNLKKPGGLDVFHALVDTADVVVESFRPGVAKKLHVDYETLRARNPGLVYCSITGYGQEGPYKHLSGHDINYVSIAGLLGTTGLVGQPVLPSTQVADIGGGSLMGVVGILSALLARSTTGEGQYVDVAMTDGAFAFGPLLWANYFATGGPQPREGHWSQGGEPYYQIYAAKDGHVAIGLIEQKFWEQFCEGIGRPDLKTAQFSKTDAERATLKRELETIFARKTRAEWFEFFQAHDIPGTPVLDLHEVPTDPHVQARELIREVPHPDYGSIPVIRFPVRFSTFTPEYRAHAPKLGQHTREVLGELGYDKKQLRQLRRDLVVGW